MTYHPIIILITIVIIMIMIRVRSDLIIKREHAVLAFVSREAAVRSQAQFCLGGNIVIMIIMIMLIMR